MKQIPQIQAYGSWPRRPCSYSNQRIDDGGALPGSGFADKERVLLARVRLEAGGVLDQVVVDLHPAISQIDLQGGPLAQGIVNQLSPSRLLGRKRPSVLNRTSARWMRFHNGPALVGAHGLAQGRSSLLVPQGRFNAVEVLDLAQEPATDLGRLFPGLVKPAPRVRPAARQNNGPLAAAGKGRIRRVTIALKRALKIHGMMIDRVQTGGRPAGKQVSPP